MKNMMARRPAIMVACAALVAIGLLSLVPQESKPSTGLALLRMALALVAIVALIRASIPFLQAMNPSAGRRSSRLKLLSVLPLEGKQKAAIILVDEREFLLGLSGDRVSLLAELDGSGEPVGRMETEPGIPGDFLQRLRRIDNS